MTMWHQAAQFLERSIPVTLLVVTAAEGSTPGKLGFSMLVSAEGATVGTIGGGAMEFRLVETAASMARSGQTRPQLFQQEHREKAPAERRSGMICAGSQTLLAVVLLPARLPELQRLLLLDQSGQGGYTITAQGWSLLDQVDPQEPDTAFYQQGSDFRWVQRLGGRPTAYIFGGGHVGLAVCQVLSLTDFHVVNFDHRPDVASFRGNTYAHRKVCGPYEDCAPHLQGKDGYAVVVTTAYPSDVAALKTLSQHRLTYVGLMGSQAKMARIFTELKAAGVDEDWLKTIRAPIGVRIANRTPVEIAISIAAELIDVRNRNLTPS